MKKVLTFVLAIVMVVALATMTAGARTLTAEEKALFQQFRDKVAVSDGAFRLPEEVLVQGENWLMQQDFQLTAEQIAIIKAEFVAAQNVVREANTGKPINWTQAQKDAVLFHIDNAAQQVGLRAGGKSGIRRNEYTSEHLSDAAGIYIYDASDPSKIIMQNNYLIQDTGVSAEGLIIAGVSMIALLGTCVIVSKKAELF